MATIGRIRRSPWLWILVGVVLAFSPRVVAVAFFSLAYATLMFATAHFSRREWLRAGTINRWPFRVRRRWAAMVLVGAFAALGAFTVVLAFEALIVGVPSN